MNAGEIFGILIAVLIVIVLLGIIFTDIHARNKAKAEKLAFRNAIVPGVSLIWYGDCGGGDPFKDLEHQVHVIDVKCGWVKFKETLMYQSGKHTTGENSAWLDKFVNWILLHRDVQFFENK